MGHTIKSKVTYLGKAKVGMICGYRGGKGVNNHSVTHTWNCKIHNLIINEQINKMFLQIKLNNSSTKEAAYEWRKPSIATHLR